MPKKPPRPSNREHWDLECRGCASGLPHAAHPMQEVALSSVEGDPELIEGVCDHVRRHVGPIAQVLHEERSRHVHVDVHIVRPTAARPHYTLVTSGMGQRRMTTPPGSEAYAFGELVMKLPRTWRMSFRSWRDEKHYWPIRWLMDLARYPHEAGTWLGRGHTIPNGVEAAPFAPNTNLCGFILDTVRDPPELAELELSTRWSLSCSRRCNSSSFAAPAHCVQPWTGRTSARSSHCAEPARSGRSSAA
jgi:hypothetical protein